MCSAVGTSVDFVSCSFTRNFSAAIWEHAALPHCSRLKVCFGERWSPLLSLKLVETLARVQCFQCWQIGCQAASSPHKSLACCPPLHTTNPRRASVRQTLHLGCLSEQWLHLCHRLGRWESARVIWDLCVQEEPKTFQMHTMGLWYAHEQSARFHHRTDTMFVTQYAHICGGGSWNIHCCSLHCLLSGLLRSPNKKSGVCLKILTYISAVFLLRRYVLASASDAVNNNTGSLHFLFKSSELWKSIHLIHFISN